MIAQIDSLFWKEYRAKIPARLLSYALFEGRPITTRGRWVNPIVLSIFAAVKRLPQLKSVSRPIFIAGTGRSGTTVLGVVLSIHREVGFLNEPKALWYSFIEGEDVIGSYSRKPARFRLDEKDATNAVRESAHRLYGAYTFFLRRTRVVDKYPEVVFRIPFVRQIFPDARFVFLTRNGWDACASITSWSARRGVKKDAEVHDWWGVDQRKWNLMKEQLVKADPALAPIHGIVDGLTDHRVMAAVEWVATMREGLAAYKRWPESIMWIQYEELARAPDAVMRKLLGFCELGEDQDCLRYARAVLKPVAPYATFDMPNSLFSAFCSTMQELGY